jgi:hypothetical protein
MMETPLSRYLIVHSSDCKSNSGVMYPEQISIEDCSTVGNPHTDDVARQSS